MSETMTQAITRTWWRLGWARGAFPWIYGYRHLFWRVWWRAPTKGGSDHE